MNDEKNNMFTACNTDTSSNASVWHVIYDDRLLEPRPLVGLPPGSKPSWKRGIWA